jgi:tetratricopeptide (TPR) repeat protein
MKDEEMMTRFAPAVLRNACLAAVTVLPVLLAGPVLAVQTAEDDDLNSLSGRYLAARTADVEKDIPNAARFYSSALQSDPDNTFLIERAMVLSAAAGEMADALRLANRLRELQPDSHPAGLVIAVERIREKKYADALESLGDAKAGVLADLTTALLAAWAAFGDGETEKALADLEALKGEDWYEPFKLLHRGYIALAAGRTDEALAAFETARERDANAVRIVEAYARALAVAGRADEAENALGEFLEQFPDNALAHAALEDVRAGRAHVDTVATPVEGAAEALAGIGAAVGQEGGVEVAALYLRLALYLDRDIAGGLAALSLGSLFDANEQSEAAINAYELIGPDEPFRALGSLRAALSLDRLDRTDEAEAAFNESIARNPDDVQTYLSYGNMLRGRERFQEAVDIYSRAIERIPEPGPADWSVFYFRGITHERTKQWPKAEDDFRKALDLSPNQPLVMNYLGYSWVDMGMNLDEGIELIRKAVELRPNDGYIVDSLGWAHYRLGDYEKAVTELERAVSLRPEDPVIHDHLGDAYWKTGRTLEAQFQWRHARDFGAEGPELELILKKIAEERLIETAKLQKDASLYVVKPGDSLWTISAALLKSGDAFQRILDANKDKLTSPDNIQPGMQLLIPSGI